MNVIYFFEAVIIPIALATVLFLKTGRMTIWFAFMAYIWSVTEDAPVYLDSVFSWPEVTSGFQHIFLEILFHLLTFVFMAMAYLSVLLSKKDQKDSVTFKYLLLSWKFYLGFALLSTSFVLSYAQNLPLSQFESISGIPWYNLDIEEHTLSIMFLYATVRIAASTKISYQNKQLP